MTERIRFCDTEKTLVKMTWIPGTMIHLYKKGKPIKRLIKLLKKKRKKAGRDSEAFYNYLLPGVLRATRPAHAFVKIWSFCHENIAATNHPFPLISVEQLSAGRLVQEQCG